MNLTDRHQRVSLAIEFYDVAFNNGVSLPKPGVSGIYRSTCFAVGVKPLS